MDIFLEKINIKQQKTIDTQKMVPLLESDWAVGRKGRMVGNDR